MPQTVFATAPIVFAPPSATVTPPQTVPPPPVTPPPAPPRSGEGSSGTSKLPPLPERPLIETPVLVTRLPSPLQGGVTDTEPAALPPAFFASDDETDDEDDYAPPHTDDDAEPIFGALTGGVDTETDDTETDNTEPVPVVLAAAAPLLLTDEEDDEVEAEADPIDDGPSLFDEEFPNPTPAFVPPLPSAPPITATAVNAPPLLVNADEDETEELVDEDEETSPPAVLVVAAPEEPAEPEGPVVTLDDVMRAWPDFLRKAGMVSKKTEMMMVTARPVSSDKSGIEIAFGSRATFDMMNTPVAQGFVRNVLLRSLGVSHVAVRFILDESASPAPPKRNTSKEKKTVRDPLAELDALEKGGDSSGFGQNGSGNAWNSGSNNGGAVVSCRAVANVRVCRQWQRSRKRKSAHAVCTAAPGSGAACGLIWGGPKRPAPIFVIR